jgi:hypothetical protein
MLGEVGTNNHHKALRGIKPPAPGTNQVDVLHSERGWVGQKSEARTGITSDIGKAGAPHDRRIISGLGIFLVEHV